MKPLTTAQLAAKWGVSKQRVSQWVDEGRLTPLYDLRPWLFAPSTKRPKPKKRGRPQKQSGSKRRRTLPKGKKQLMTRSFFAVLVGLAATAPASAVQTYPLTLTGTYRTISPYWGVPEPPAPPWDVYFGDYVIPGVMPSDTPQVWPLPLTEVPELAKFGLGGVQTTVWGDTAGYGGYWYAKPFVLADGIVQDRSIADFTMDRAELELEWWVHTHINGGHRLTWRIYGDGRIVPEPAAGLWLLALPFIARRGRKP